MSKYSAALKVPMFFLILAVTAGILSFQGRSWISESGNVLIWVGNVFSSENSQQIFDPYSLSHILHGIIFYYVLAILFARSAEGERLSLNSRFLWAAALEAGWEILENSPVIINRYREGTISLGYTGDSILNSMMDIWCCGLGFWIASKVGFRMSALFFIVAELLLLLTIHDNLTLNIIMLIYPIEAIKDWQASG